jgi:two-component system nitrogen regulation sensor histidine kinase GlnL
MASGETIKVDNALPFEAMDTYKGLGKGFADEIIDGLGLALLVCDRKQKIQYANPKAEELLNHSKEQLIGHDLSSILHIEDDLIKTLKQAIEHMSEVSEQDITIEGPRVKKQVVSVEISPNINNDANKDDLFSMLVKTTPDHQRISNNLIPNGRGKSVESMSAVLAHEIKNPLSGIKGAAQLLRQSASEKDKRLTNLIGDECDRILNLINQMQTFSDPELSEPESYNIHEVIMHVIDLAKQGFGADIVIDQHFDPSLPNISGSKDQMIQALLNLLKNAAEATPEQGGRIQINTAWRRDMRFKLGQTSDPVFLPIEITIQDNGAGISDDIKQCLFDPFVTNKPQGTGLGLALVKRFISNHGGLISAINSETQGACFQIFLPPSNPNNKPTNESLS